MTNSKNINWVDSAELKAVKIDKTYGKKETYTSVILMSIVIYLSLVITSSFLVIEYGELAIASIKQLVTRGNFFNIALYVLSAICLITFGILLWFSIVGINKTKVGINHQVNTKDNYTTNIVSLVFGSIFMFMVVVLTIFRIIMMAIS